MKPFTRILYPIDLSEPTEKIMPYVIYTVEKFDCELHVLYVLRGLEHLTDMHVPYTNITEFQNMAREGAERSLSDFCNTKLPAVSKLVPAIRVGDAAREILQYVQDNLIDMIVMGTHGRKGVDRLFFGSVADKVVKSSPVPVMTVNPHTI